MLIVSFACCYRHAVFMYRIETNTELLSWRETLFRNYLIFCRKTLSKKWKLRTFWHHCLIILSLLYKISILFRSAYLFSSKTSTLCFFGIAKGLKPRKIAIGTTTNFYFLQNSEHILFLERMHSKFAEIYDPKFVSSSHILQRDIKSWILDWFQIPWKELEIMKKAKN